MTVPVVWSLAHQYPDVRITVLSRISSRPLFEGLAPNVGFMGADLKIEYRGIRGLNTLFRRLTAKQFTAIADLHDVLRSEFLRLRFNMGNYQVAHINKHRKDRRRLTSKNNKQLIQQPTSFENYLEVFERLGYPIKMDFKSIFPPEGSNLSLLPPPVNFKNTDEQWIGIAPFAAHKGKI
jgi:ADP-heptose:LPS heptosyltransferase